MREFEGRGGEAYAESWGQHAGCDDEIGEDKAGHAKGKEDRLPRILRLYQHRSRSHPSAFK